MIPSFTYIRPDSLAEALVQLRDEDARAHAGGTDLLACLRNKVLRVNKVVGLGAVKELRGIEQTGDGGLRIGALTTIAEVASHPLINRHYTALARAAAEVGSPQLRNQGTLGGNLCQKPRCWYYRGDFHCLRKGGSRCYAATGENRFHCIFGGSGCFIVHPSDTAPALVALNARLRLSGPWGNRVVEAGEFHVLPDVDFTRETVLEPDEIVTDIVLPAPAPGLKSFYRKVRGRGAWDFALAGVALAAQLDGDKVKKCRVALSGAAPVPWRARQVEKTLIGKQLTETLIKRAARAELAGARPLRQNHYKLALFEGLLIEQLRELMN